MIFVGILAIGFANAQDYLGNVGINTSTPSATLNVKSLSGRTTSETKNLELENGAGTKLVTVLNNGNVGIGKSSPSEKLEVGGNVLAHGGLISKSDKVSGSYVELNNTSKTTGKAVDRWRIFNLNNVDAENYVPGLHFWAYAADGTNLSSQMLITDGGNLGIGFHSRVTSSILQTNEKLEVNGMIRITAQQTVTENGSCTNKGTIAFGSDGNFYGCTGTGTGAGTWKKLNN